MGGWRQLELSESQGVLDSTDTCGRAKVQSNHTGTKMTQKDISCPFGRFTLPFSQDT